MNKKSICIIFIGVAVLLTGIILTLVNKDSTSNGENSETSKTAAISDNVVKSVDYDSDEEEYEYDIDTYINLESDNVSIEGSGASNSDGVITINKAGNYSISGTLNNGKIIVDTDKNSVVKILLNGVNITSNDSSPIFVKGAKKCILTLKEGTESTLEDASSYTYENSDEDEPRATIFSKQDLIINGKGTLKLKANYNDAISSNDALRIFDTNIEINSVDDGIRGKDYVYIKNSNIKVEASGDGIKSTNTNSEDVGYVIITDSTVNITSGTDGIDAKGSIYINGGKFNIVTGGSSSNSQDKDTWGKWDKNEFGKDNMKPQDPESSNDSTDTPSAKGIKSATNILIDSGEFNIDSSDDSIHSNNTIKIENGTYEISSGDDGIHADSVLTINDGSINIKKSYEGCESAVININGGDINIVSSDDGINVAGGKDSSSEMGRPGQNNFSQTSNYSLNINGGNIEVDAKGDGLDSNGNIYINGGDIKVFGPTDDGNGALDYDGTCEITGGNLVAIGSSGMMQAPSSSSSQYSLAFVLSSNCSENSVITIKDSSGDEVLNITAKKLYKSVVFSSSKIKKDETYTIYIDGTESGSLTASSITTTNGKTNNMGMPSPNDGGNRPGGPRK